MQLQRKTQKHLFKELECSFVNHDQSVQFNGEPGNTPLSIKSVMQRLSIGEGEAHLDTSRVVFNMQEQVALLQQERDQLIAEKQEHKQEIMDLQD